MVIPRSRSSGALSIVSKARYSASPLRARYLVIAAVRLVLPWSMWPIVPMFTCGLVRSNFFLAIVGFSWFLRSGPALGHRPQVRGVAEHLGKRDGRTDHGGRAAHLRALDETSP